jgi:small GTP-binding protein
MRPNLEAKVILLGSATVGKTSIVKYICSGASDSSEPPTVGAGFSTKRFVNSDGATVLLNIWDTAGHEKFWSITPMYVRNSNVAVLVFSLTNTESFRQIYKWYNLLEQAIPPDVFPPVYLVGNKLDLVTERLVLPAEAGVLADEIQAEYFETSAASGVNIESVFLSIADRIGMRASTPCALEPSPPPIPPAVREPEVKPCC